MKKHSWNVTQAKSALVPNFGKKYIAEPNLLKALGNVKNKRILELGSGNGYWLELLSRKGAICTGIEISKQQIQLAQSKAISEKIKYLQGDITDLGRSHLKTRSFDVIFLMYVLLEISSFEKLEKIFKGAYKLLKPGGKLIIADLHPFAPSTNPPNMKVGKNYNYFSSGAIVQVMSQRIDGKKTAYKDIHWTLEDLAKAVTRSGLQITDISEPRPTPALAKKHHELAYRLTRPMNLMLTATRS